METQRTAVQRQIMNDLMHKELPYDIDLCKMDLAALTDNKLADLDPK